MATIMNGIKFLLDEENTDPRTRGWLLASSPLQLVLIVVAYLYLTLRAGPRFMEHRKPYQLKTTLIVYNALQVIFSGFLVVEGTLAILDQHDFNFHCQPMDYRDSPNNHRVHTMVWWYYFAKITELLDTVLFVLRKKDNQVTFLHVYHHATMPFFAYIFLRYFPNGQGTVFGVLNSFVHIVMYAYYLIASLGPRYQKYLWWKKHMTTIQLVQFSIVFFHNFPQLFTSCSYPKLIHVLYCFDSALFFYLFGRFYINSYFKPPSKSKINGVTNGLSNSHEEKAKKI